MKTNALLNEQSSELKAADSISLFLIGDSIMADKPWTAFPKTGWGTLFGNFFNKGRAEVFNRGVDGISSRSYLSDGYWDKVLGQISSGSYVLVGFGHNDEKIAKSSMDYCDKDFKKNLCQFVHDIRLRGAVPVLLTPVVRRCFKNGQFKDSHGVFPDQIRHTASELEIPLIDLHRKTLDLVTQLGPSASCLIFNHVPSGNPFYPEGRQDDTHFNMQGASIISCMVTLSLFQLLPSLSPFIDLDYMNSKSEEINCFLHQAKAC